MFNKNNFFNDYFTKKKEFNKNLKKTRKVFNSFLIDFNNNKFPLLKSYEKNYEFDFSKQTIKKFSKYKNIIIIGMGGSILGAKTIYSFFQSKISKNLFFFDNLDENLYLEYKKIKNLKNSCFIVVSKSGNTLETIANLSAIFSKSLLKNKLIIITEIKDNNLMNIANRFKAEIIEHKEFISGRYSVLSEPGMFPSALMGLNLKKFKNLKLLIRNKNFVQSLIQNVASIYTLNNNQVNNSVILSYDTSLNNLGYWYQQLVAESLGKKGKGINPTISFGPRDHHSLLQLFIDGPKDKFFTFFGSLKSSNKIKFSKEVITKKFKFLKNKDIKFVIHSQYEATRNIFKLKKIPYRKFEFNKKNEEELGKIFTFFVLETILLSRLMKVNPFNQPSVELVKIETKKFLK